VIELKPNVANDAGRNRMKPFQAATPSPTGAELVFHDPLSDSAPAHSPGHFSTHSVSVHDFRAPKRLKRERAATRADAIEAVSRELELLRKGRGKPPG
jgi:hypothetical protein